MKFITENQEIENDFSDDDNVPAETHDKLLDAVSQLYRKQKIEAPSRNEPTTLVSEYNLSKGSENQDVVQVNELIKVLDKKATHNEIARNIKILHGKGRTLKTPLERIYADRIARSVGYEAVTSQLSKWDAVIFKNRAADQLTFPLKNRYVNITTIDDYKPPFKEPTELEVKMNEVLSRSEVAQKDLEIEKEMISLNLPLNELIKRRKMMAKVRARESYKMVKAIRQSKIKSKKYHRILKREKMKKELKDFEVLQKTNPEAALEKLERIERARAEERMSLRHKSTGKWAKSRAIVAKYDLEARAQLAEQLAKGRELTKKLKQDTDSEDDNDDDDDEDKDDLHEKDNPWVNKSETEISDFISGYRKFWDETYQKTAQKNEDKETTKESEPTNDQCDNKKEENIENEEDKTVQNVYNSSDDSDPEIITKLKYKKDEKPIKKQNPKKRKKLIKKKSVLNISGSWNVSQKEQDKVSDEEFEIAPKDEKLGNWSIKDIFHGAETDVKKKAAQKCITIQEDLKEVKVSDEEFEVAPKDEKLGNWSIEDIFHGAETDVKKKAAHKFKTIQEDLKEDVKVVKKRKAKKEEPTLAMKKKPVISFDESLLEICEGGVSTGENNIKNLVQKFSGKEDKLPEIDPNQFIPAKPKALNTEISVLEEEGDDGDENENEKHINLVEAFADDDIVDQFRQEKEKDIEESQPKNVDLTLPGWGHWAGCSMPPMQKRKKRRFVVKFPEIKRKDNKKDLVIIHEDVDVKLKDHMVNELPHPFTSVQDYEASIRAPIGTNWLPQTAHKRITAPPVLTRMGQIIEPMDYDQLVKTQENTSTKDAKTNKTKKTKKKPKKMQINKTKKTMDKKIKK